MAKSITKNAKVKSPSRATKPTNQRVTPPRNKDRESMPLDPGVRVGTKMAGLIERLRKPQGGTIEELVDITGWQSHSVRGAISGGLKKKLGLPVISEKIEGRGRVYRITASDK